MKNHHGKKILIAGAGAVGITLGALFEALGNEVVLVGGRKLRSTGGVVYIEDREYTLSHILYSLPSDTFFDYIFVTSKQYNAYPLIQDIQNHNIQYKFMSTIQNGLVPLNLYTKLGIQQPVVINIYEGYDIKDSVIKISKHSSGRHISNDSLSQPIFSLLQQSGINIHVVDDVYEEKARKTILNCGVNGLCAIYNQTIGNLLDNHKDDIILTMKEAHDVLAHDYNIEDFGSIRDSIINSLETVRNHFPTTHQDVSLKRGTEIDALNGYIVTRGKELGIKTPKNQWIWEKVKSMENQYL